MQSLHFVSLVIVPCGYRWWNTNFLGLWLIKRLFRVLWHSASTCAKSRFLALFLIKSIERPLQCKMLFGTSPIGVNWISFYSYGEFSICNLRIHSLRIQAGIELYEIYKGLKYYCFVYFFNSFNYLASRISTSFDHLRKVGLDNSDLMVSKFWSLLKTTITASKTYMARNGKVSIDLSSSMWYSVNWSNSSAGVLSW